MKYAGQTVLHRRGNNLRPRSQRGFTWLELALVVSLIGILAAVFLVKIMPLFGEAERVGLLRIEAELKNALVMEAAKRIVQGRTAEIASLEGANPFQFVLEAPANYLGELEAPDPASVPARHWYFDSSTRRLVYRVHSDRFESDLGPPARAEYEIRLSFDDRNSSGAFEAGSDDFRGVRLVPVAAYRWRKPR